MSGSVIPPALSFKIALNFHMNFRINLSVSTKSLPEIFLEYWWDGDEYVGQFGENYIFTI